MLNTRPLDNDTIKQLELNFSTYLDSNKNFIFKIGNKKNHRSLNLMEVNLEKICFAVGPGNPHINSPNLIMEEYIESDLTNPKPIDFCYKVNYKDESRIMGFIENKIIRSISEQSIFNKLDEATKQIYDNYLKPLKKRKEQIFSDLSPKNFSISVCLFYPEIYLEKPSAYYNYCNDGDSSPIERIEKYGFVMLTLFVHTESINSAEGLNLEFKKFFNSTTNFFGAYIIPELITFNGFIQKDVFNSIFNMSMTTTLPQLNCIPYSNINPSSRITNTRNLSANSTKNQSSLQKEIFSTLVSNYKKYESGNKQGYDLAEAYRSLGAKPREISFYIPQTIVHINQNENDSVNSLSVEERMNQQISFLTCNMSMIDGQHSSKSFEFIIDNISNSAKLDLELQAVIDNIYGNSSTQFTYHLFKNFLNNHHINLSFKGFFQEDFAQQAAINQNNIKKQTDIEKIINEYREKILKIANSFNNRIESKYKLDVNKGSWTNAKLDGQDIELVSMDSLVNVFGVWNQKEEFFLDEKNINRLLGKSNSPCNPITNSTLEKSIDWYIKMDKDMSDVTNKINKIINHTYKIINFHTFVDNEDSIDDLIQENITYIQSLETFLDSINYKFINDLREINRKLRRAIDEGFDHNWSSLLDSLYKSSDMLNKYNEIWEDRIDTSMLLYTKSINFLKNYGTSFFTEKKTDTFYHIFSLINVFIRLKILKTYPQHHQPIQVISESFIDTCLIELSQNLAIAEIYINQKPLKDFQYGGAQIMDSKLMNTLFKF